MKNKKECMFDHLETPVLIPIVFLYHNEILTDVCIKLKNEGFIIDTSIYTDYSGNECWMIDRD